MLQTLFYIPHEFLGWPVFGRGWLLAVWALAAAVFLVRQFRRQGWNADTLGFIAILAVIGGAICFLAPHLEEYREVGTSPGLPIRGYGVMLLAGVLAGLTLAIRQAQRMGVHSEVIVSLSFAMFVGGIVGARTFYVIQYWSQFWQGDPLATIVNIINVTQGGLVVYGAFLGGVAAGYWYLHTQRLPILALADLMAPSLMLGLSLGRIGCLLNGCCFGGVCSHGVTFPQLSPPYDYQRSFGQLHGFRLAADPGTGEAFVQEVEAGGLAEAAGLQVGERLRSINGKPVESLAEARSCLSLAPPNLDIQTDQQRVYVRLGHYPERSRPAHPAQLYSAIDGAVLCFVLWAFYPFRRRDGEVAALLITLYPLVRILEEKIRTDEPGRFGTPLTISQWVSVLLLLGALGFWAYLQRRPRGSVLPPGDTVPWGVKSR